MVRTYFDHAALIDTSAVVAALDQTDSYHKHARAFLHENQFPLFALDVTSHECYTRIRYASQFSSAIKGYNFLRSDSVELVRFDVNDEKVAEGLLRKYEEHKISFHDAICAAAMKRLGLYKIFTFDKDFAILGFQLLPGHL